MVLAVVFVYGLRLALSRNFHDLMHPHIEHHIDTLAAEIGTPPSIERAQALVAHLPLKITIKGPTVNWSSHPDSDAASPVSRTGGKRRLAAHVRVLADGHRIVFRFPKPDREGQPALIGAVTLAVLLLLTAASYWLVRRLSPAHDIRAEPSASAAVIFRSRSQNAVTTSWASRPPRSMPWPRIYTVCSMPNANYCWPSATSPRSPLTRARLNTELLAESGERLALLSDLAVMRDLIEKLLESERLNDRHAALHPEPTDLTALVSETVASYLAGSELDIVCICNCQCSCWTERACACFCTI